MILTCVYVHVKPGTVDQFVGATVANHNETIKEQGNVRFDFLQQADDPCSFMLYEVFESEKAAADHKNTPHYFKWRDAVADMMAEPRKGIRYNIIKPEERIKW